jgi:SAM-dependent methyltransferase
VRQLSPRLDTDAGRSEALASLGLDASDFTKIATRGFGDPLNSYAHSMAWFRDHLYVGTTRANLCMVKAHNPPALDPWPIKCPNDYYTLDRRAQIWRYSPHTQKWQNVYVAPIVRARDGAGVPRDIGYRGMAVFQASGDRAPALHVCAWSPWKAGKPPIILRTYDGVRFQEIPVPTTDPSLNSFRALFPFEGRLFTAPTGRIHGGINASGKPVIFTSANPASGAWEPACADGFGDHHNLSVFELAAFNGFLYAGTLNPSTGLQIWKTKAQGEPPHKWISVVTNGADRGPLNECALSFCEFDGALYVGTGIQNGGYDRAYSVGPGAAELIRIYPDDTWDLIVGKPRLTPQGYKRPLSGLGPGFDNFYTGYIWRMAAHEGQLYAATYDWSVFLPYLAMANLPAWFRRVVEQRGMDAIIAETGGFDLWRSPDGVQWTPVTRTGFGNPHNYGGRTMLSTPFGLFIGTANPFGPEVAVRTPTGWEYRPNSQGGLEVWLGKNGSESGNPRPAQAGNPSNAPPRDLDGIGTSRVKLRYDESMYGSFVNSYYDGSDFTNFGYWEPGIVSQKDACENLMEKLLGVIPKKEGKILDVACGKGATTRHLLNHYQPDQIVGINISEKQLDSCRRNAAGVTFLLMDATRLEFPDRSFDTVICVEAAFHFDTRENFLKEAFRVLKPGGWLVLSDILLKRPLVSMPAIPKENCVTEVDHYRRIVEGAGFEYARIFDATTPCWVGFCQYALPYAKTSLILGSIDWKTYIGLVAWIKRHWLNVSAYILVCAKKGAAS